MKYELNTAQIYSSLKKHYSGKTRLSCSNNICKLISILKHVRSKWESTNALSRYLSSCIPFQLSEFIL